MIGRIIFYSVKSWEAYKNKRPLIADKLDEAVVKEIDDKYILVEENRLTKILEGLL